MAEGELNFQHLGKRATVSGVDAVTDCPGGSPVMRKLLGYVLVAGTAAVLVDLTGVEAGPKASLVAAVLTAFVAVTVWSRLAQAAHERRQTQDRSSHE